MRKYSIGDRRMNMCDCWINSDGKSLKYLQKKPAVVPLYPPPTLRGMPWEWTQVLHLDNLVTNFQSHGNACIDGLQHNSWSHLRPSICMDSGDYNVSFLCSWDILTSQMCCWPLVNIQKIFRIILSCANPWPLTALYWKKQNTLCCTVFYKSYITSGICRVCLALFLPSSRTVTSVSFHFTIVFEIIHKIMEYSRDHF